MIGLTKKQITFGVGALVLMLFGFIGWIYYTNIFSKEILRLDILGPSSAKVGEEIEYTIRYKNNGNFVLENLKLNFSMPEYSLTEDSRTRIAQDLKDIYPGEEKTITIKTRLLGKEGDVKTAKASISYVPKNLTARYESDTSFSIKIESVPINLDFDLPSKVEKGKLLDYSINYFSNVDYPLENLSVKVAPTTGFIVNSAEPTSLDNSEWKLKTLLKTQGGRITIHGKVDADAPAQMTFMAQLGMWQNGVFVVIKEKSIDVQIIQSQLSLTQQVNGSSSYVASPGQTLNYKISLTNNSSSAANNLLTTITLRGQAFDFSTIQATGAQVNSSAGTIIFDPNQNSQLKFLDSQQTSSLSFSVKIKSNFVPSSSDTNGTFVSNDVSVAGISQTFKVKVNAGLSISQKAFYQSSDISNSGPIPPVVGKSTTYTIVWSIKNYSQDQKNVKVKAILPQGVGLTGSMLPEDESVHFSFDSLSREIIWSPGDILAGTGVQGDPVELSFQISLTPSVSQVASTAPLIGKVQISGENQFTNTILTSQDSSIDTSLPDDPQNGGSVH